MARQHRESSSDTHVKQQKEKEKLESNENLPSISPPELELVADENSGNAGMVQQMKADSTFQMKGEEEEESMQAKKGTAFQMKGEEEEESIQAKKGTAFQMKGEEEEESMQAKMGPATQKKEAPQSASNSSGMPEHVQGKMEQSLGADFSNVNIHKDSESATNMGALAYTQGEDVHFAPGQFSPESQAGQELIGHELTHVVQQREGRVQPTKETTGGKGLNDDHALEAEADNLGAKAAQAKFDPAASKSTDGKASNSKTVQKSEERERALDDASKARQIWEAVDGAGTDEEAIWTVLRPLNRSQVKSLKGAFKRIYGVNMVQRLADDLTDSEMRTALRYMLYWPYASGPLGSHQVGLAKENMIGLPDYAIGHFTDMIDLQPDALHRAYLYKAIAAGRSILEIIPFAYRIHGQDAEWLNNNLRLTASTTSRAPDANSTSTGNIPAGIQQQWQTSCATTTMQAIKGEMDPIYALEVHDDNPNLYSQHAATTGTTVNPDAGREQRTLLRENGGRATSVRGTAGGSGMTTSDIGEDNVGVDYDYLQVLSGGTSIADALTAANTSLDAGVPCPMSITAPGGGGGHAVSIISRSGNTYQVHDPWDGGIITVTRAQFLATGTAASFNIAGWNTVRYIGVLND